MADAPTFQDIFDAGRREILVQPTRITNDVVDIDGSDANIVVASGAAMGDEVTTYALALYQESFLATASGRALDRWINDRYQLPRQEAVPAVTNLQLERSNVVGFTIVAGSVFSTNTGVNFRTIDDVVFPPNISGPFFVTAVCQDAGLGGNVPAGSIVNVQDTFDDDTLTVTNPEPAAGGANAEEDDEYRARGRDFFLSARRGTKNALEIGARSVAGIQQATAQEFLDPDTGSPFFRVQLLISDISGQANVALAQQVIIALDEYRGFGVPVSVLAAQRQDVPLTILGLQFEAGFSTTTVLTAARNAIIAVINILGPGETLRRASLYAALESVDGLIVPDGAIVEPAGDVVPISGRVLRSTTSLIAMNQAA